MAVISYVVVVAPQDTIELAAELTALSVGHNLRASVIDSAGYWCTLLTGPAQNLSVNVPLTASHRMLFRKMNHASWEFGFIAGETVS